MMDDKKKQWETKLNAWASRNNFRVGPFRSCRRCEHYGLHKSMPISDSCALMPTLEDGSLPCFPQLAAARCDLFEERGNV